MEHTDMVGFKKGIDSQLPVDVTMQNPRLVVVTAIEAVACKFVRELV
jgi:hypothetical protein